MRAATFLVLFLTLSLPVSQKKPPELPKIVLSTLKFLESQRLPNIHAVLATHIVMIDEIEPWLKVNGYDKSMTAEYLQTIRGSDLFVLVHPGASEENPSFPIHIRKDRPFWKKDVMEGQFDNEQLVLCELAGRLVHEYTHTYGKKDDVVATRAQIEALYLFRARGYFRGTLADIYIASIESGLKQKKAKQATR